MSKENQYDYIIVGAGLSGLMLAVELVNDAFFKEKKILLIDKRDKTQNDRTWCFWLKGNSKWNAVISKKWSCIIISSETFSETIAIAPYTYNKIEGRPFYAFCLEILKKSGQVTFKQENFVAYDETKDGVTITTEVSTYTADRLFTSILPPQRLKDQKKYQVLNQHFIGWFIKTEKPVFDPDAATFMDFSVAQKENTRFMYVLPTSPTEALVEYTLFSEKLLPEEEYESSIEEYLLERKILDYKIVEKERGCIPMTAYPFEKHNGKNILHIGTAGGWTRGSTGFTFRYSEKRTDQLVAFLKNQSDLRKFNINDRYRWYDKLFLDVLYRRNDLGSSLFTDMFKKNPTDRIFRFLDGDSSLIDDLKTIWSLPKKEFITALFRKGVF